MPYRRLTLALALIALTLMIYRLLPKHTTPSAATATQTVTIQGRWKDTRASLGLPPLPDTFTFRATQEHVPRIISRIELRRRSQALEDEEPELYFAEDALEGRDLSLQEMSVMFRAVEKEDTRAPTAGGKQERKKDKS